MAPNIAINVKLLSLRKPPIQQRPQTGGMFIFPTKGQGLGQRKQHSGYSPSLTWVYDRPSVPGFPAETDVHFRPFTLLVCALVFIMSRS